MLGRRLRALRRRLDVVHGYRRQVVAFDAHVDNRKRFAVVRRAESVAQLIDGGRLESFAAPVARELRIWPRRNLEQLAPLGDWPEYAPSAVVDQHHDWI